MNIKSKGIRKLWQTARRLKHCCLASRALIFMYHRVTDLANDPYVMAVTPNRFADQMEVVRKYYSPLRLSELVQALRDGNVPRRAIVVTFDDGYADNLYNAKPILERYEIPATVFVTTGQIGNPSEFWWDELDRLLLQPGKLPVLCELPLNGRTLHCQLDEAAVYTTSDYERHCGWHIERQDDPTPRHTLHRLLYQVLHSLTQKEQERLLDNLRAWAGAGPTGRATHRTLSPGELSRLADGRLIEIGAHTVTHAPLGKLPLAAQRDEVRHSRSRIEELLNDRVISFAYPHGSYTQETLAVVQEAGFSIGCSSDTDVILRDSDILRLPRVSMRNWDGASFEWWLSGWMG